MVRNFFFAVFLTSSLLFMPIQVWAGPAQEIEMANAAKAMEEKLKETYVGTKYATAETGIYQFPNETAEVYDNTRINTTFEVLLEENGWSMISAASGYAYIKSEFLSTEAVPVNQYSDEDLYVMAHVLAGESQNCPDQEQLYVGSVVLNRVANPVFPNTIKGVVFQKGQYACIWDGNYYREPTARNWANAKRLLEQGSILPPNVIWQSGGKQGKGVYIKTKWHYYCYS